MFFVMVTVCGVPIVTTGAVAQPGAGGEAGRHWLGALLEAEAPVIAGSDDARYASDGGARCHCCSPGDRVDVNGVRRVDGDGGGGCEVMEGRVRKSTSCTVKVDAATARVRAWFPPELGS